MTLTGEVAPPSQRRPDLPPELEAILMRALSRDPAQRYATAAEMRDELETWLSNRELMPSATMSQLMERLFGKEMREHRAQVQGLLHTPADRSGESGVTLVAPLLGAGTFSGLPATQVSSVTDLMQELTRQRRVTTRLLSGLLALVGLSMLVGLYLTFQRPTPSVPVASAGQPMPVAAAKGAPVAATTSAANANVAVAFAERAPRAAAVAPDVARLPAAARATKLASRAANPRTFDADAAPLPTGAAPAQVETGVLNFDTTPWSMVSVGGKVLGQTPLVGVALPVGTHTLMLSNPDQGLKTAYQVTITAGHVTSRRIGLD